MGGAESTNNPVRNMDKRTARREYRDDFEKAIMNFRKGLPQAAPLQTSDVLHWESGNIRVCARKRPIFSRELKDGEFDVISCYNRNRIIVHDARMHADMKHQFIKNNEFEFDFVFDEKASNNDVYGISASPLVNLAFDGGYTTCMVYGQTGSGKTFTMSSVYQEAAQEIFRVIHEKCTRFSVEPNISVSYFEIAGDNVLDLLNKYREISLVTGAEGNTHPYPAVEVTVKSAEELMSIISYGQSVRTTAATGVHDSSSRSHSILRIYIQRVDLPVAENNINIEGVLTLVDLAGSEHRIDSMFHNADRRKEGALINSSLMALKDCIRQRSMGKNLSHLYRKSKLTMALKGAFAIPQSRTVVIATVSPSSKDTEHSLNTLRHAEVMDGHQNLQETEETRFMTGGKVTTIDLGEINLAAISRKNFENKKKGVTSDLKTSNGNNFDASGPEMTEKMKRRMRVQSERRAYTQLPKEVQSLIQNARNDLYGTRQQYRIQLPASFQHHLAAAEPEEEEGEDEEDLNQDLNQDLNEEINEAEGHGNEDRDDDSRQYRGQSGNARVSNRNSQYENEENDPNINHEEPLVSNIVQFRSNRNKNLENSNSSDELQGISNFEDFDANPEEVFKKAFRGNQPRNPDVKVATRQVSSIETVQNRNKKSDSTRLGHKNIYDSVYSGSGAPSLLRRQFISLLKIHGYETEEIKSILVLYSCQSDIDASASESSRASANSKAPPVKSINITSSTSSNNRGNAGNSETEDPTSLRKHLLQSKSAIGTPRSNVVTSKPETNAPRASNSSNNKPNANSNNISHPTLSRAQSAAGIDSRTPEKEKEVDRHALARAKREQLIAEENLKRNAKIQMKSNESVASSSSHEDAIAQLEMDLQKPGLSAISIRGINQQIAKHRAAMIREKNKSLGKYQRDDPPPSQNSSAAGSSTTPDDSVPSSGVSATPGVSTAASNSSAGGGRGISIDSSVYSQDNHNDHHPSSFGSPPLPASNKDLYYRQSHSISNQIQGPSDVSSQSTSYQPHFNRPAVRAVKSVVDEDRYQQQQPQQSRQQQYQQQQQQQQYQQSPQGYPQSMNGRQQMYGYERENRSAISPIEYASSSQGNSNYLAGNNRSAVQYESVPVSNGYSQRNPTSLADYSRNTTSQPPLQPYSIPPQQLYQQRSKMNSINIQSQGNVDSNYHGSFAAEQAVSRSRSRHLGAASAPFGNEYNENDQ